MTYDTYRYIFIGAAIACGIMFAVTVFVFIFLKIPKVISDLTGATARKAIKNIREQNEASGDKGYKVSAFNEARGKLTDKISPSGNVIQQHQAQMRGIDTTKINTQELIDEAQNQTSVLDQYDGTAVLGGGETSVLSAPEQSYGETSVLSAPEQSYGETSVLSAPEQSYGKTSVLSAPEQPSGETAVLSAPEQTLGETSELSQAVPDPIFCVEFDITYIHTNEIIA